MVKSFATSSIGVPGDSSQSQGERAEFANGLRALAAISVVLSHLAYTYWRNPQVVTGLTALSRPDGAPAPDFQMPDFGIDGFWGYFGVGLFFLISGFVIPFSTDKFLARGFLVARACRIWPTYAAGLTLTLLCVAWNAHYSASAYPNTLKEIAAHYLIIPRWPTLTRPIDGIIWTLEIELFFYALCALLLWRLRDRSLSVFLTALGAVPAAAFVTLAMPLLLRIGFPVYALAHWLSSMLLFVSFMLIGTAFHYHARRRIGAAALLALAVALFLNTSVSWRIGPLWTDGWSGPASFAIATTVFGIAYELGRRELPWPKVVHAATRWMADISYPLYVVHGVIGYSIMTYALNAGFFPWQALAVALCGVTGLAFILHKLIELPSRNYGRRVGSRLDHSASIRVTAPLPSTRAFKVCHIAATTEGATWMLEQLRDLRRRKGYDVCAIISAGEGSLAGRLEDEGIRVILFDFEFPSVRNWKTLGTRVIDLARIFRRERFDVVQTHLFASMVLGRLASWLADVPVRFAMIAGPYHLEAETPRWIDASTCWMESGLIASCEYTRALYRQLGVPSRHIFLIYYGPDASKFDRRKAIPKLRQELALSERAKLIGMVAYFYPKLSASRWTPQILHDRANKRQEDLIRAAPKILSEFPDAKILLIGSAWGEAGSAEVARAKLSIAEMGLENSVLLTGYRSDVNDILASLDVAVQASLSENLGGTIESLLMECPTVATRTGGMVDSIRDGETGVLVGAMDPDDLANGVLRILRDQPEGRRMAAEGRNLMLQQFTLEVTVDNLDDLYRRSLARHQRGYRMPVSALRAVAAAPIFAYLAARLLWDTKFAPRWRWSRGQAEPSTAPFKQPRLTS